MRQPRGAQNTLLTTIRELEEELDGSDSDGLSEQRATQLKRMRKGRGAEDPVQEGEKTKKKKKGKKKEEVCVEHRE